MPAKRTGSWVLSVHARLLGRLSEQHSSPETSPWARTPAAEQPRLPSLGPLGTGGCRNQGLWGACRHSHRLCNARWTCRSPRLVGEGEAAGRGLAWALTLTQLGGHRTQAAGTSQDLPSPWCPCTGGHRRDREERPPNGLRPWFCSAHGPESWAPCHVHTPTGPSGLDRCFASGVTMVPERPELLCQHWASTTGTPARSWVRVGGGLMWPEQGAQGI